MLHFLSKGQNADLAYIWMSIQEVPTNRGGEMESYSLHRDCGIIIRTIFFSPQRTVEAVVV